MTGLHLIACVAGRAVAVPADQVESVIDLGPITPTPCAAPGVVGLAALRSRVITVIDPRAALDVAVDSMLPGPSPRRAIVSRIDGHTYAILVDSLEDVASFAVADLPAGIALSGGWGSAATGLIDRGGEPVLVVALAALVPQSIAIAA